MTPAARVAFAALAGIASMAVSLTARAAPPRCGDSGVPWLRLELDGDGFGPALRARVTAQLRLDLGAYGVAVCEAGGEPGGAAEPLGAMHMSFSPSGRLAIELHDDVTNKRLARDVALSSVPRDARGLSIALAAEELLHASWIEAALAPPPAPAVPAVPPDRPVPAAVVASNEAVLARAREAPSAAQTPAGAAPAPRSPMAEAAVTGNVDRATGGMTAFGGDIRFLWGDQFAAGARLGLRSSLDVRSANGSVRSSEIVAGLVGAVALVDRSKPAGVGLVVHVDVFDLQVSGIASPGATAASGATFGVAATGGVEGWLRVGGPWRVVLEGCAGGPLHGATASDSGVVALSVTGALFGAALGVGATL
jgi:hypothetical protein